MSLGSFCLIKNEGRFIKAHLDSWLPHIDQMVFFDGGSTDGTLEALKNAQKGPYGAKIRLFEGKDPIDLKTDYVRLSNDAMWALDTDLAAFVHPDMILARPGKVPTGAISATMNMRSFAGDPGGQLYEVAGRDSRWKNIYRLRNPDLGAHYYGNYGVYNEDVYFSDITGDIHEFNGQSFDSYPYPVHKTDFIVEHYSDLRPYARRLERMIKCRINQGVDPAAAAEQAPHHPRVSFKDGDGLTFKPVDTPPFLK